jgi:hypothetical protein
MKNLSKNQPQLYGPLAAKTRRKGLATKAVLKNLVNQYIYNGGNVGFSYIKNLVVAIDIKSLQNRFVMCPLLAPAFQG